MSVPAGGAAENTLLRPLAANALLVQARTVAGDHVHETVTTSVFSADRGQPVLVSRGIPILLPLKDAQAIAVSDIPFPRVSHVTVIVRQEGERGAALNRTVLSQPVQGARRLRDSYAGEAAPNEP
jgi:hypothetical protein